MSDLALNKNSSTLCADGNIALTSSYMIAGIAWSGG
jgi:hypothetical protein